MRVQLNRRFITRRKGDTNVNQTLSLLLMVLMINIGLTATSLAAGDKKGEKAAAKLAKRVAKVKDGINKLGVGTESKVKIKLTDKTKVKGHISGIDDDGFTVTDKIGAEHLIPYEKAKQVKGNNLHAGVWVAIGVGAALLTFLIIFQQFDS